MSESASRHRKKLEKPRKSSLKPGASKRRKRKNLNILLLGQSGVGKSTWINAILNYVIYDTLHEAKDGEVLTAVPSTFTVTTKDLRIIEIKVSGPEEDVSNENQKPGASATQNCKTYTIPYGEYDVNIIDTPGIGDTRGIEQDRENIKLILDHIRNFDYIHGVCILMKPNEARLTTFFKFCITQLLTHLHKSASKNILFCFTNSRAVFYKPGETFPVLKKLLEELQVDVTLNKERIITLDNESYRYLCILLHGENIFNKQDTKSYSESWNRSVEETKRMLDIVKNFPPHKIQDTLTLNETRRVILTLSKPLAEITRNIEYNINVTKQHREEIEQCKTKEEDLKMKRDFPEIKITPNEIPHPRTVCTSLECSTINKLKNFQLTITEHTKICHDGCTMEGVIPEKIPDEKLRTCRVMLDGICKVCGCSWEKHMRIFYQQTYEEVKHKDKTVQRKYEATTDVVEKKKQLLKAAKRKIRRLEKEKQLIIQACATFGQFLKKYSITPYNDTVKDYLSYLIETEKSKSNQSDQGKKVLKQLEENKKTYEKEVDILEKSVKYDSGGDISPEEIKELLDELKELECSGNDLEVALSLSSEVQRTVAKQLSAKVDHRSKSRIKTVQ